VLGRIATGGAVEQDDVGVETFEGEAAEAGLDTETGELWFTAVVIDSDLNGAASALPGSIPGAEAEAMAAAMLIDGCVGWLRFAAACSGILMSQNASGECGKRLFGPG
jgi:hypothetical protein